MRPAATSIVSLAGRAGLNYDTSTHVLDHSTSARSPSPEGRGSITTPPTPAPGARGPAVSQRGRAGLNYDSLTRARMPLGNRSVSLPGRAGLNYDYWPLLSFSSSMSASPSPEGRGSIMTACRRTRAGPCPPVSLAGRAGLNYDRSPCSWAWHSSNRSPSAEGQGSITTPGSSPACCRSRCRESPSPEGRGSITTGAARGPRRRAASSLPARKGGAQLRLLDGSCRQGA